MIADPRTFSMSVLTAAVELRKATRMYPSMSLEKLAGILSSRHASLASLDYPRAIEVHRVSGWLLVPFESTLETEFRSLFKTLILALRPTWMQAFPLGRQRLTEAAPDDAVQILRSAGLLDSSPGSEIVEWWDSIASIVRAERETQKLKHGREAEALSFLYEKDRLNKIGIDKQPVLMAMDDNLAGFDILSYDRGISMPIAVLIEVKSASDREKAFVITRAEWNRALACRTRYEFQIWSFPSQVLATMSVDEMLPHVPVDRGNGSWERANVRLSC